MCEREILANNIYSNNVMVRGSVLMSIPPSHCRLRHTRTPPTSDETRRFAADDEVAAAAARDEMQKPFCRSTNANPPSQNKNHTPNTARVSVVGKGNSGESKNRRERGYVGKLIWRHAFPNSFHPPQ